MLFAAQEQALKTNSIKEKICVWDKGKDHY